MANSTIPQRKELAMGRKPSVGSGKGVPMKKGGMAKSGKKC